MPAAVPAIAGYAAAKGGSGLGSTLTNTQEVRKPEMDQNAFRYGGQKGGADAASQRVQGMGAAVGNEQGSNYYNMDRNLSLGDRNAQVQGIGAANEGLAAYRQAMNGQVPSVAEMQMQRGLGQAQNAAASTAASARGGGANLAAAQRMAAQQQGQLAGQSNEASAMLRANEMAQARQGFLGASQNYQGAANSLRGADQAQGNMSMQNALGRAQLQQGYEGQGQGIQAQQLNAQMAYQQANANNDLRAQEGMAKVGSENAQGNRQLIGGLVSGGASAAAMASDVRLKENVHSGDSQVEQTLNHLKPISFDYKQPEVDGEGTRLGIKAQDLAKTPMGANVVQDTPRGMYLDNSSALSLALAANANLNERVNKLEGLNSRRSK